MGNLISPSSRDRAAEHGDRAAAPEKMMQKIGEVLAGSPLRVPQIVADAARGVVKSPPGKRSFRLDVDASGVAALIIPQDARAEKATEALFTAYRIGGMLDLETSHTGAAQQRSRARPGPAFSHRTQW